MEKKEDTRWYRFMSTDRWIVFINIVRIVTLLVVVVLIYIMVSDIEAIKLLAYDPCQICIEKTGATCFTNIGN